MNKHRTWIAYAIVFVITSNGFVSSLRRWLLKFGYIAYTLTSLLSYTLLYLFKLEWNSLPSIISAAMDLLFTYMNVRIGLSSIQDLHKNTLPVGISRFCVYTLIVLFIYVYITLFPNVKSLVMLAPELAIHSAPVISAGEYVVEIVLFLSHTGLSKFETVLADIKNERLKKISIK